MRVAESDHLLSPAMHRWAQGVKLAEEIRHFFNLNMHSYCKVSVLKDFSRCDVLLTICILVVSILILPTGAFAENTTEHATDNGPVLLWSVPNGDFNYASGSMKNIACPGDGSIVIAGYSRGVVGARNRDGDLIWSWRTQETGAHVWSVESSPKGKYTGAILSYTGSERNDEFVYLDEYGNILWKRTLSKNPSVWGISQSENGKIIAIPGPGNVSYFDETGKNIGTSITGGSPWLIATSDDGNTTAVIVSGSFSPYRLLLTGPDGTIAWEVPTDSAIDLAISGDGRYILLVGADRIRQFSSEGRELWNYSISPRFTDVSGSEDGSYVAAEFQYYLWFFNRTGDRLSEYKSPSSASQPDSLITSVSISGNGEYVSAQANTDLLFFDRNGTLLWLKPGTSFIYSTCMSSDGKYLGVASQEDFRYYDTGITSTDPASAAGPATGSPVVQDRHGRGASEIPPTRADIPAISAIIATCALILITGIKK